MLSNVISSRILFRGIVIGIITGIVFYIVYFFLTYNIAPVYLLPVYLIVIAVLVYKFVGHSFAGLSFGLAAAISWEVCGGIIYGYIPFQWLTNLGYLSTVSMLYLIVKFVGFPLTGLIAGKYSQNKAANKLPNNSSNSLNEIESKVLSYIKSNNNRIDFVECAMALNTEPAIIENAVKSLQQKGEIQT